MNTEKYHGRAHQMRDTHAWVEKQLMALGYNTEGLLILNTKKSNHDVMLDGRRLFVYDYSRGVIKINDDLRYNRLTGFLESRKDRFRLIVEPAEVIELALKIAQK